MPKKRTTEDIDRDILIHEVLGIVGGLIMAAVCVSLTPMGRAVVYEVLSLIP